MLDNHNRPMVMRLRLDRRIPQGAKLLATLSAVNALLGFGREATVAYFFGTSQDLDSFLVALTFPALLVTSSTNITVSAIVPPYVAYLERGDCDAATRLVQSWFAAVGLIGIGVCLGLGLFSSTVVASIAPGLGPAAQGQAAQWLCTLLPYFWIMALAACFKVVLDSHHHFAAPALGRSSVSLSVVVSCLLLAPSFGITALTWGYVFGGGVAFLVQWWRSRTIEPALPGRWMGCEWAKLPLAGAGTMALHSLSSQVERVIDRGFASTLPVGSIASLNYASGIISLPNAIFFSALATVLFPAMSSQTARGEGAEAARTACRWALITIAAGLVPVALLIRFRLEIVSILFERGEFGPEAAAASASVLSVLPFMIMLTGSTVILNRLLLSQNYFKFIVLMAVCALFLKVVLNCFLVPRYGLVGLAVATVAAASLTTALRFSFVYRRRGSSASQPPD